jgi:hypothetical protein
LLALGSLKRVEDASENEKKEERNKDGNRSLLATDLDKVIHLVHGSHHCRREPDSKYT